MKAFASDHGRVEQAGSSPLGGRQIDKELVGLMGVGDVGTDRRDDGLSKQSIQMVILDDERGP